MHSGFSNLRSALPMNLKAHYPGFKVWAGAQADIDRICASGANASRNTAGRSCSASAMHGRRHVSRRSCTRFLTYDVKLDRVSAAYGRASWTGSRCRNGIEGAKTENPRSWRN